MEPFAPAEAAHSRSIDDVITPLAASSAGGGEAAPDGKTLWEYGAILRKRASLVFSVFGAFLAVGVLYLLSSPSLYSAQTTIEIRGHAPVLANLQSENLFGSDTRKIEYQKTTVAKLKLEGVADQVLSTDGLADELAQYWDARRSLVAKAYASLTPPSTPATQYAPPEDQHYIHTPSLIRRYLSLITIVPVHETNLVTIEATTAEPELSQKIANGHALGFIKHLQDERRDAITANVTLLQRQASDLKSRVTQAEQELGSYAAANKLLTVRQDEASNINVKQIETLSSMLADAVARRIKSESLLNEAQSTRADESSVADDEVSRQLRVTLKQAETEYASQASNFMGAHPVMLELKAKVDALKKSLSEERRRSLRTIQGQYDADRAAEQKLRTQIEEERASAQDVAQRLIQYNVLSKEVASLRDLYQAVVKQVKEAEISAATSTSNVFVTDYASLPTSPSAPQANVIIMLFAIVGLSAGVFAALVAESLQDTLNTVSDIHNTLGLPMLATIPQFAQLPSSEERLALSGPSTPQHEDSGIAPSPGGEPPPASQAPTRRLISITGQHDPVSEALRTLRASILLSSADHPPRTIMVSSAVPGEGKTTIVGNLAAILTQGAYRVVVIDADLRLSGLSELFQAAEHDLSIGLTDLLTGQAALEQVLRPTDIPGLDIIPAGNTAPDPAELLGSQRMKHLVQGLREQYDFVLIDAPPVLPVADSLMLSRVVDCVVMVVRSNVTERKRAQEARRRLLAVRARILGVVLTDVNSSMSEHGSDLYGSYTAL